MNAQPKPIIVRFTDNVASEFVTLVPADPFGIDDPCPFNPAGHDAISSCGDIVCCHCSKVFWR